MSIIITTNLLRNTVAQAVITFFGENSLYLTVGRQLPWVTEPTPPTPIDNINQNKLLWDNMMFAKLITLNNLEIVAPRYNWINGNVYTAYTDTATYLPVSQFYIYTSNNEIYKCLANNGGGPSTVEPYGLGTAGNNYIQTTSDGYQWKYMLDVETNDMFLNDFYFGIPTIPPPGSIQSIISAAAVAGSIDVINVTNKGNNYTDSPQSFIINISGDGTGANAYANVRGGEIQNIVMTNRGSGYSFANVTFTGTGTSATATAIMPPPGGHGFNAVTELMASTVMVSTVTSNSEVGFLTTSNKFRQIGLLLNPKNYGANTIATGARMSPYMTITVSGGVGSYSLNETVFQGISINNTIFSGAVIDFDPVAGVVTLNNIVGNPVIGNILYGLNSGTQRYVTAISNPTLQLYTGEFLDIDNEPPIQRNSNQQEQYQLVLSF
jgi:hypothetical protein